MFQRIVREICKVIMFVILWGLPVLLSWMNNDNKYLWLFCVSVLGTIWLFNHYEDLERIIEHSEINQP